VAGVGLAQEPLLTIGAQPCIIYYMTTDAQERIATAWFNRPEVDRLDVIQGDTITCHMFQADGLKNLVSGETEYDLIAVGTITADGQWELHGPTEQEYATIRPITELVDKPSRITTYRQIGVNHHDHHS
jgi:hypothetical protein